MSNLIESYSSFVRDFFQNRYDSVVNLFGVNDLYLDVFATLIISLSVYWSIGTLYTILDVTQRPKFLYKYKIQDEKVTFAQIVPTIKRVFFNQTVIAIPFLLCIYYYKQLTGYKSSREIPTLFTIIKDWIGFLFFQEISFYYTHRLFHIPQLYKYTHKLHHGWQAPIAIAAMYAHPLEHIASNLLSQFLGPTIMHSHRFTCWVWLISNQWETLNGHSGYHFPLIPSPEFHDYHHSKFTGNYGVIGLFDWLHGTDQEFRKSINFRRHRLLTGLEPVKYTFPDSGKQQKNGKKHKKN
jgi:sterol desaturase/sphingolipid hydroxylase (fatty acid hydroxylase superfamily)